MIIKLSISLLESIVYTYIKALIKIADIAYFSLLKNLKKVWDHRT